MLTTKLKVQVKLFLLVATLCVVAANLLQIITAGSNQQGSIWAIFLGSVMAAIGYYVKGDISSYKRFFALILALICSIADFLGNGIPLFAIGFVLSIWMLVGFSSDTLKRFFKTTPSVIAIILFIPLSLMHSSLMSLVTWTAANIVQESISSSHKAYTHAAEQPWQAQIDANTLIANTWEETVRVGMYLAGIQNPFVNTALWSSMHLLPDRAVPDWLADANELTKKLLSIGFLFSISLVGLVILRVFVLTQSYWNVLIVHVLFNLFGPRIYAQSITFLVLSLIVFLLSLIWIQWILKHLESLNKKSNEP